MKIHSSVLVGVLFTFASQASTLPLFYKDKQNAGTLVRGNPMDADAQNFYNRLNVPTELIEGYNSRKIDVSGEDLVIHCIMSPRFQDTGSCMVTVKESALAQIDYDKKTFYFEVSDSECSGLVARFHLQASDPELLFQSANGKLKLRWIKVQNRCVVSFKA